ncbi:hypothetical protein [Flavobacterium sp. SM2513]|uniref:hypothetical protein n=1 Tax=Flavobacterium sp. SM2513 TaxID=3424766 RepID=UPI003D7FFDC1
MDTNQLQNEKLNIINWVTEIQDASIVEKIKVIMGSENKPYKLSLQQEQILEDRLMEDKNNFIPARDVLNQLKKKYDL